MKEKLEFVCWEAQRTPSAPRWLIGWQAPYASDWLMSAWTDQFSPYLHGPIWASELSLTLSAEVQTPAGLSFGHWLLRGADPEPGHSLNTPFLSQDIMRTVNSCALCSYTARKAKWILPNYILDFISKNKLWTFSYLQGGSGGGVPKINICAPTQSFQTRILGPPKQNLYVQGPASQKVPISLKSINPLEWPKR